MHVKITRNKKDWSGTADSDLDLGQDIDKPKGQKLKNWAHGNPMMLNRAKCKVLHLGQGNPQYPKKSWTWAGKVLLQPRKPPVAQAASKTVWPAGPGRGFWPSTLHSRDPTCNTASSSGVPGIGRTSACWSESRGAHENNQKAAAPLPWGQVERIGLV